MKPCFNELDAFLASLKGARFVYIPNPGNAGDNFIAHGTHQCFKRLQLDYEIGDISATYPGRVVVYAGGGNLVPLYFNFRDFLRANAHLVDRLVILPHTIQGHEDTLAKLGPNCDIFCRERMSHEHVKQYAPQASAYLSHDMAFFTDFASTAKAARDFPIPLLADIDLARSNTKRLAQSVWYKIRSPGTLDCFRLDSERTAKPIPSPNFDASRVFATGFMAWKNSLNTTYGLMRFVGGFKTVNTNRLHIGILAAMLGKTVNLYDNSYGKNRAVYEHSMTGFDNVNWHG